MVGRTAVVTGAGRGLGRAIALGFASEGAQVVLAARSVDELQAVAAEVRSLGASALAVPTDVTNSASVDDLVGAALAEFGAIDVLVNNSGVYEDVPMVEMSDEQWDRVVSTNLRGTFLCSRAVGRHFMSRSRGRAVNIASNLGLVGRAGFSAYCASKAAIINFTRAVALEWAQFGSQMNAIAPGYFETDFNTALRADHAAATKVVQRIPARRMGMPDELATLCTFLACEASDFINGETVVIDGAESIR
jgi:3-oxoacyl-[acyl-carrier protein] reductase/2-deoxy-D-gluconate 3-dehydrogenase